MSMSFPNPFYIRQVDDNRFMLCIKESHYCMTAGTFESCIRMVTTFVKRYKRVGKLYEALRKFDDHGKVGRVCFEEREQWYQTNEWKMFDKDVRSAVREGLEYLEDHTSTKRVKKVLSKVSIKPLAASKPMRQPLKAKSPSPFIQKKISKPRLSKLHTR